jgi:hypothetical protein
VNIQTIAVTVIPAYLSQPDETTFSRVGNSKRGQIGLLQVVVVSLTINFCPCPIVQRTFTQPRLQWMTVGPDCVMGRADAPFVEIPAYPLTWLVL